MPPTFAYGLALFAYICFGGALLAAAALLAIPRGTRMLARSIAGGTVGSYPGVFIGQLLCMPLVVVLMGIDWALTRWIPDPTSTVAITFGVGSMLLILGCFAAASLMGFISGWSVGSSLACGSSLGDALHGSWILRRVFFRRR